MKDNNGILLTLGQAVDLVSKEIMVVRDQRDRYKAALERIQKESLSLGTAHCIAYEALKVSTKELCPVVDETVKPCGKSTPCEDHDAKVTRLEGNRSRGAGFCQTHLPIPMLCGIKLPCPDHDPKDKTTPRLDQWELSKKSCEACRSGLGCSFHKESE